MLALYLMLLATYYAALNYAVLIGQGLAWIFCLVVIPKVVSSALT